MKKKRLSVICIMVALIFALGLSGCGGTKDNSSSDAGKDKEKPAATAKDAGELGDYTVAIKDYQIIKDYEGNNVILVNFDFTNNSDESAAFDFTTLAKAFQDGVELEISYFLGEDVDRTAVDNGAKEVKPGTTIAVAQCFLLTSDTSDVEVEITELLSFTDDAKLVKTFSLA